MTTCQHLFETNKIYVSLAELPWELIDLICETLTLKEMSFFLLTNKYFHKLICTLPFYAFCKKSYNINKEKYMINLMGDARCFKRFYEIYPHRIDLANALITVCRLGYFDITESLEHLFFVKGYLLYSDIWHYYFLKTACENGYIKIAEWITKILRSYPKTVTYTHLDARKRIDEYLVWEAACVKGHLHIIQWLRLNTLPLDADYVSRLFYNVCLHKHFDLAQWLLSTYPQIDIARRDSEIFRDVCRHGDLKMAKWLIEICPQIDIHAQKEEAFRYACKNGYPEIVKWLIDICSINNTQKIYSPINIRIMEDYAFQEACLNNHLEIAKFLINICPEIKLPTKNLTMQHLCKNGCLRVIQWLLEIFPNIFIRNACFLWACERGKLAVAKFLIAVRPKIFTEKNCELAFRYACKSGNLDIVKWLIEICPQINIHAKNNLAHRWAIQGKHLPVIEWFEKITNK